ncbi:MAG: hypothetical protein AAF696_02535 [Bacteroidota bacterium]
MKLFKMLSLMSALVLFSTNISLAQENEPSAEQKTEMAKAMQEYVEALNLSDDQKPEFEAIMKKYLPKLKAVKDSGEGKFQMYKKVKAIRKDQNAEMEKLLSEKQYEAYLEKQEEMQERMKAKRG